MPLSNIQKFACASIAGAVLCSPAFLLLKGDSNKSKHKLSKPSINWMKSNAGLDFGQESLFGKKDQIGKKISFWNVKISIDGQELKGGDMLCSLAENGKYFLMRRRQGPNKWWVDELGKEVHGGCLRRTFGPDYRKWPKENITLKGMRLLGAAIGSSEVSQIHISSCFFTPKETKEEDLIKRSVTISNCKSSWAPKYPLVSEATLVLE